MTDPVDTGALRTPYDHFPDLRQAYSDGFERAYVQVDRLHALIKNAPQDIDTCNRRTYDGYDASRPCTCWKADVL